MPFTPFHLGPGALVKAFAKERFSFLIFGGAQVLMDVEPLVRILRGDAILHGLTHTVAGASVIAGASGMLGVPIVRWLLSQFGEACSLTWTVGVTSALAGTYSHILLDAIMHGDMRPWAPFTNANGLLGIIPPDTLYLLCLACGCAGAIVWGVRELRRL